MLDEPIAGVDVESQRLFRDSLVHLVREHDAAVLLVSHELGAVADDLDHVIVLKRRVLFDGKPGDLAATGVSLGVHRDDLPLWLEELRLMGGLPGMPWALPWPFDRSYMQLALLAGIVVGATAPLIGVFLVQKGCRSMGDGIGHVAVAGIGASLLFGTSPTWTALVVAVAAALVIEFLPRSRQRDRRPRARARVLRRHRRGCGARQPLGDQHQPPALPVRVDPHRDGQRRVDGARARRAIVLAIGFTGRALLAVVLDEDSARCPGIPARALNAMLAVLTAVTVVTAMRIVGVLLVAALMVLPVATSRLLARSFRGTLGAVGVGVISAVLGLFAARQWALAAGAIVLVAAALFALASIVAGARRAGAQADSILAGPH